MRLTSKQAYRKGGFQHVGLRTPHRHRDQYCEEGWRASVSKSRIEALPAEVKVENRKLMRELAERAAEGPIGSLMQDSHGDSAKAAIANYATLVS